MSGTSHWHRDATVDEYLDRVGTLPPRLAGESALREVLPDEPTRVADLGCGDGRLTALVLDACPSIQEVVAVDDSPPMLAKARERFATDARVRVHARNLNDDLGPLGRFDAIVSGFAIHHLDDARKQTLTGEIARALTPGGVFANLEVVQSATPALHATFQRMIGRTEDDPDDRLVDIETQLAWMRNAGLLDVDCLWQWRGFALLVGVAPAPTSPPTA